MTRSSSGAIARAVRPPPPFSIFESLAFNEIVRYETGTGLFGEGPIQASSTVERGTVHPNT